MIYLITAFLALTGLFVLITKDVPHEHYSGDVGEGGELKSWDEMTKQEKEDLWTL